MSSLKTTLVVLIIALSNLGWASTYVKDLEILCQSLERVYPAFPIKEKQLGLTKEKFKRTCELEKAGAYRSVINSSRFFYKSFKVSGCLS